MKKYSIWVAAFTIFLGITPVSYANDSGPMPDFIVKHNKITCVSAIDPENIGSGYFLVFDYSPAIGAKMGKPWSIVEKGKCYQVDADGGDIYRVQIINGNEREKFGNYSAYNPTDDIPLIFCNDSKTYNQCGNYTVEVPQPDGTVQRSHPITKGYVLSADVPSFSRGDVTFSAGLYATALFPIKYDFGFPITFGIAFGSPDDEGMQKITGNPAFIELNELYHSLTKELENTVQSCDTRMRLEYQYKIGGAVDMWGGEVFMGLQNIVWRFAGNKDISFGISGKGVDDFITIETIGCKPAFSAFIKAHQSDFDTMDKLIEEVDQLVQKAKSKYPEDQKLEAMGIHMREAGFVSKILDFVSGELSSADANNTTAPSFTGEIHATALDEPTAEKKTDVLLHSENPFMRVYIFLPAIALCSALVLLVVRKFLK